MAFEPVKVAQRVTAGTGISASCTGGDTPRERLVRISLTRDAQVALFGRKINPATDRFDVQRGTDTDKGKVLIRLNPEGEIVPMRRIHDCCVLSMKAFPPVPQGKVKGTPCAVIESDRARAQVIIRLPWRDGSAA